MNGSSRRHSQSSPSPLGRPFITPLSSPGSSSTAGLIPSIASRLRSIQSQNNNALGQVIAQLEAANDLQSELVNARASHARMASDLRTAVDQNISQGMELQRARDEVISLNIKLTAAREQMRMLESRVVSGDGVVLGSATRDGDAQRQIDALLSALTIKNERIAELHDTLRFITEAAAAARTVESAPIENNALVAFSARMQELDKWLSTAVEASDREMEEKESKLSAALSEPLEGATQDSTVQSYKLPAQSKNEITQLVKGFCKDSLTGKQALSQLLSLRSEFENVLNFARASMSRSVALEAALMKIMELRRQIVPLVTGAPTNLPTPIEVSKRLPEASQATLPANTPSAPTPTQSRASSMHRPSAIQLPSAIQTDNLATSQPSTPSLSAFASPSGSPLLKRKRTMTEESHTPGALNPSDELYAFVRLVNTTYEIRQGEGAPGGGGDPQVGPKRLVCRMCENRHKAQPDYAVTTYDYDRDDPLTIPPPSEANSTRALVRPWVAHIQEMHQKLYIRFMENFERMKGKRQSGTTQS